MSTTPEAFPVEESNAYEIMKDKLGDTGMQLIEQQLDLWHELNGRDLNSPLRQALSNGDLTLPEGTLVHGLTFDADKLRSIAEKGIISGELTGVIEDSETHGCADFFKVPEEASLPAYFEWTMTPDRSGPIRKSRGERNYLGSVAIVVDPQTEGIAPLLTRDAYADPERASFTQLPSGRSPKETAAILGGVPRGAIAGIVLGDREVQDPAKLATVTELFPAVPVLTRQGELLSKAA